MRSPRPTLSQAPVLRGARGERGSTLLEFALVCPLLLTMVFAIVDFGWYSFVQHTIQFATREGVRLALVGGTINDKAGNRMSRLSSIIATIQNEAAVAGIKAGDLKISVYPIDGTYQDPKNWKGQQDAGRAGQYMRVRTQYDYPFLTPVGRQFKSAGYLSIEAQATYKNEMFE